MRYLTPILAVAALTSAALFGAQHSAYAATTPPAHADAATPAGIYPCEFDCVLSLQERPVNVRYDATSGLFRVAASVSTTVTFSPVTGSTYEIIDVPDGGCMDWVDGTGIVDGGCGIARSNWELGGATCSYGFTLTNVYAQQQGDDDVLSAGAVGAPLNMAPAGRCAVDTGWEVTPPPDS
jgi:hypothetical protein